MNEHLTHHAFVRSEMQLGLIKEINPASGSNFLECKLPPCILIVFTSQKYSQKLSPFCTCLSRQKYWEFQLRLVPDIGWCQLVSGQCQFRWCPWKAKFIHSKTKEIEVGFLENILEEVFSVFKSEKGHCVRHHPNVATSAIIVRLCPSPVLVFYCQDFVCRSSGMSCGVVGVRVISWKQFLWHWLITRRESQWSLKIHLYFCCRKKLFLLKAPPNDCGKLF